MPLLCDDYFIRMQHKEWRDGSTVRKSNDTASSLATSSRSLAKTATISKGTPITERGVNLSRGRLGRNCLILTAGQKVSDHEIE